VKPPRRPRSLQSSVMQAETEFEVVRMGGGDEEQDRA
jgi:hypothetical protein